MAKPELLPSIQETAKSGFSMWMARNGKKVEHSSKTRQLAWTVCTLVRHFLLASRKSEVHSVGTQNRYARIPRRAQSNKHSRPHRKASSVGESRGCIDILNSHLNVRCLYSQQNGRSPSRRLHETRRPRRCGNHRWKVDYGLGWKRDRACSDIRLSDPRKPVSVVHGFGRQGLGILWDVGHFRRNRNGPGSGQRLIRPFDSLEFLVFSLRRSRRKSRFYRLGQRSPATLPKVRKRFRGD